MKNLKTYQPKAHEVKRNWHLVDAKGEVLGRMAVLVATKLIGKHKPNYSAHMDSGDFVVVINAKEVKVTGNKENQKKYYRHSGYPGGFREISYRQMKTEHPERIIEIAVKGMLPDNRLKSVRMTRLFVFEGENHTYGKKFEKRSEKVTEKKIEKTKVTEKVSVVKEKPVKKVKTAKKITK